VRRSATVLPERGTRGGGREAAVGMPARGPDSALKARVWRGVVRARGSHAATAC
jgi:hypothetical protein